MFFACHGGSPAALLQLRIKEGVRGALQQAADNLAILAMVVFGAIGMGNHARVSGGTVEAGRRRGRLVFAYNQAGPVTLLQPRIKEGARGAVQQVAESLAMSAMTILGAIAVRNDARIPRGAI